ncbi:hypothetical protein [Absidia glauca]|uniref:Uncharacterized protein n=1 Tax=Absidia glauca TaxID=4829 RepID=A0A168SSQ9_ABSGL|nr:hypothetical protein [Absidia glauca]
MPFPSIRLSTKKQHKRRHSAFSHHDVNQCDVLSKPFLPLDLRISSPTELIDLAGHPRLALEPPSLKPAAAIVSPVTPIPGTVTDKTLLDPPPPPPSQPPTRIRIHFSETSYNEEYQAPLQPDDRRNQRRPRRSPSLTSSSCSSTRTELDRLWQQYDHEQSTWRQRLDGYRRREEELMDLLETARAKLDQLEGSLSDLGVIHHHHHHYYYHSGIAKKRLGKSLAGYQL